MSFQLNNHTHENIRSPHAVPKDYSSHWFKECYRPKSSQEL